jgi:signal transduction histidine kinase
MQHMVEETLSFARGLADAEPQQNVNIESFLETLRESMLESFTLIQGDGVRVRVRPNAIRRALRNVIENAQRYSGGAEVSYASVADTVVIRVCDRGPGIPEPELERVFDPFMRLEASRSRDTGGHGLGLSIARSILRGHGGDIVLTNRSSGGLCASLILPIEA